MDIVPFLEKCWNSPISLTNICLTRNSRWGKPFLATKRTVCRPVATRSDTVAPEQKPSLHGAQGSRHSRTGTSAHCPKVSFPRKNLVISPKHRYQIHVATFDIFTSRPFQKSILQLTRPFWNVAVLGPQGQRQCFCYFRVMESNSLGQSLSLTGAPLRFCSLCLQAPKLVNHNTTVWTVKDRQINSILQLEVDRRDQGAKP